MNKFLVKNPLITEKATSLSAFNKYVFTVEKNATAPEIKKVIEAVYKVKVIKVQVMNVKPKTRRLGRSVGKKPGYKKAIVTLKPGDKIEIVNT